MSGLTLRAIRKSIREEARREAACPGFHDHTPSPAGYIEWHAWARKMMRTHRQIRCTGCGRLKIWVPRAQNKAE